MAIKETIDNRITNATLSPTESKVAEYISKNLFQVCFTSSLQLGREIGTSDMSVIRTSRKLGFSGYSELQSAVLEEMKEDMEKNSEVNFMPPTSRLKKKSQVIEPEGLFAAISSKMVSNISLLMKDNSVSSFEKASDILVSSKRKFVMGFRGCASVAHVIGSSMGDIFRDVITVTDADSRALERIKDIQKGDCLVLVSYPRYNHMALTVRDIAREKKARIIAFTDRITSPVASGADVVIVNNVDGITLNDSYVAPVAAAEMLLALVYRKGIGPEEQKNMDLLEKYIHEKGLY